MYKFHRNQQMSFTDFNQPAGMQMYPENRWVKKDASIPWYDIEIKYSALFPSETGMPAKPLQTALGSLMIQKKYDYSDRELVEQIKEIHCFLDFLFNYFVNQMCVIQCGLIVCVSHYSLNKNRIQFFLETIRVH